MNEQQERKKMRKQKKIWWIFFEWKGFFFFFMDVRASLTTNQMCLCVIYSYRKTKKWFYYTVTGRESGRHQSYNRRYTTFAHFYDASPLNKENKKENRQEKKNVLGLNLMRRNEIHSFALAVLTSTKENLELWAAFT